MSDAALTNEQALKLLLELATNDGFRQRFETKPAAALVELGIPHETVVNLNAACLAPLSLQTKDAFQKARVEFSQQAAGSFMNMVAPHLKLVQGQK